MTLCSLPPSANISIPGIAQMSELSSEELWIFKLFVAQLEADEKNSNWPCIKPHFQHIWIVFAVLYAIVGVTGIAGNFYMIVLMYVESTFQRVINYLLFNLFLSDIFKCCILLPISLSVLLLKQWRFGRFICIIFPMIQMFPLLLSVITYVLIGIDRYMTVFHPSRHRQGPTCYIIVLSVLWVFCGCLVLPYKTYMKYFDLETYFGHQLKGQGICVVGFGADIREFNSASFIALFAIPIIIVGYLLAKVHNELSTRQENRQENLPLTEEPPIEADQPRQFLNPNYSHSARSSFHRSKSPASSRRNAHRSMSLIQYVECRRTQTNLFLKANQCFGVMLCLFTVCWTPMQCLMLVFYVIREKEDVTATADLLFTVFLLIGFCSTITNPLLLLYQRKVIQSAVDVSVKFLRRFSSVSAHHQSARGSRSTRGDPREGRITPVLTLQVSEDFQQEAANKFAKSLEHLTAGRQDRPSLERHSN